MTDVLLLALLSLAAAPLAMLLWNRRHYRPPPAIGTCRQFVSVLIPARNEAGNIGDAIESVLGSEHQNLEVIVLDDRSNDGTAEIVAEHVRRDPRVKLVRGVPLPERVSGKAFACHQLSKAANGEILIFIDADVRLSRDAVGRIAEYVTKTPASLVSGIPHQETPGVAAQLIVPLIHFMMLGFLPIALMRRSTHPAYGAACGQLCAVRADHYHATGGHGAILESVHDGLALPRLLRRAGYQTDLVDVEKLARCRMYDTAAAVWNGFAKNAHEGMGSPKGIVPWTIILLGGQVMPVFLLITVAPSELMLLVAVLSVYLSRALLAIQFRHPWLSVLLHPLGVLGFVMSQWYGIAKRRLGRPVQWKGRTPPLPAELD